MHIVNDIATQNNISNVTSFVHTTSKTRIHRFFTLNVIECIAQYLSQIVRSCCSPAEDKLAIHKLT